MQAKSQRMLPVGYCQTDARECPSCQGALIRERRRVVDRVYSLVKPIKRYRCENFACRWVGNFASTSAAADRDRRPHRMPVAFVVHLVLVAVGIVFVFFLSAMEPPGWLDDGDSGPGSFNYHDPDASRTVT